MSKLANKLRHAKTHEEVLTITKRWQVATKEKVWALLSRQDRERLQMLKKFQNHAIATRFPIGAKVRRKDSVSTGTITGWFEDSDRFYIHYFVEYDDDHLNKDGEKANSQWDFSQAQNLILL